MMQATVCLTIIAAVLWSMVSCTQVSPAGNERYYRYFNPYELTGSSPIWQPLRYGWSYGIEEYQTTIPSNNHIGRIKVTTLYKNGKIFDRKKYTADIQTDSNAYYAAFVAGTHFPPERYTHEPSQIFTSVRVVKNNCITTIYYNKDFYAYRVFFSGIEKMYHTGIDSTFSILSDTFNIADLYTPSSLLRHYSSRAVLSKDADGINIKKRYDKAGQPTGKADYLNYDIYPLEWL